MNSYDYLINTHDLPTLSDWGPFARDLYALSHIADRERGVKFDFFFAPGILRRNFFLPETLRECGCSPFEAAPDLSYFLFRQQLEGKDVLYCDSAYACIGRELWLGRCEFVNNTDALRCFSLLSYARLSPRPDVVPNIPDHARFIDALDYKELVYSYKRFDHNLTNAGGRRGEENRPGTVNNRCIGQPFYDHTLPCFGARKGDKVSYEMAVPSSGCALFGRIRVDAGASVEIDIIVNGRKNSFSIKGTGEFEIVELFRGSVSEKFTLDLISTADGCGLRIDGFIIGNAALQKEEISFAPMGRALSPECREGSAPDTFLLSAAGVKNTYCVWWSRSAAAQRTYYLQDLKTQINYFNGFKQPYCNPQCAGTGNEYCHDTYILPLELQAGERLRIYTLYTCAPSPAEAEKIIAAMDKSDSALEKLFQEARTRAFIPRGTAAGKKYEFSQQLMAAASLTNVNFPISKQGKNIRCHVPDKYFNSLYLWDSGFTGLGFSELDKIRAVENLNVYVTEPEYDENAFLLYGTPLPVQAYLYAEIWNKTQDREMLEFFYPRLRRFYDFIAGHNPTSTCARAKSNLLCTWDYFYNSGGWDDYPPQWHVFKTKDYSFIPAVTTSHAIRFAKILLQAARELDKKEDQKGFEQDIARFTEALQTHSWSEKDGIFSYVCHDEEGNPTGFMTVPGSDENYNAGMDGATPLVAGICTFEQRKKLFDRLSDPEAMWTNVGISTVDKRASYFRTDGYWNGCVWMPHQWFFWKAALDDNRSEFARKIAETALNVWKNEVDDSRFCFEHFSIVSGRGAGCLHFGALSSPVLNWYGAYFTPQRFTGGLDTWFRKIETSETSAHAEVLIGGAKGDFTTLLYVAGRGKWQAIYNNTPVPCSMGVEGCLEITLPKDSSGIVEIKPL